MMILTRALIQVALLVVFAGSVQGNEFWGRKLPGQPTQFILGYGSLINSSSRNATASQPIAAIPVRLSASFGYVRGWTIRSPSGFTALGLRRRGADESGQSINGVLYPVEGNDMAAFDAREEGYQRVEVPLDQIQAMSWQRLPEHGKIWVYIPVVPGQEPGVGLPLPSAAYPILQSYLDLVIEGGLEFGADYAREIVASTVDWSAYWLNDRPLARRPWVYTKEYVAIDKLLADSVPHFKDRLYAEPYAAKYLLQTPP
ncbi:MAG: gamma-glutamylcyclotransferase [Thermomicrobiales bacterium]|jgi:hypothetical protein|nr:gamma-glutamylcyclotransferase [Thermomicrobiales bacterium]